MRTVLTATIAIITVFLLATPARAQGVQAEASKSNRMAMEYLDLGEYGTALKLLTQSLKQLKDKGMAYSPVAADLHLTMGIVLARGFKKQKDAYEHFVAALTINDEVTLPERQADKALSELFAKAVEKVHPTVDCKTLLGMAHDQVMTGVEGKPQVIQAKLDVPLQKTSAFVRFRGPKGGKFAEVALSKGDDCNFAAEIPADAMVAPKVEYYLIARLEDGRLVAQKGKPNAPFVINVSFGESPDPVAGDGKAFTEDDVSSENPMEEVPVGLGGKPQGPKKGGCASCDASGGGAENGTVFLAVLVGLSLGGRRRWRRRAASAR